MKAFSRERGSGKQWLLSTDTGAGREIAAVVWQVDQQSSEAQWSHSRFTKFLTIFSLGNMVDLIHYSVVSQDVFVWLWRATGHGDR